MNAIFRTDLEPAVLWTLLGVFGVLACATAAAFVVARGRPEESGRELWLRTRSWWAIAGLTAFALVLGRTVAIVFLAFVSFLALKEYLSLIPTRRADRRVLFWAYLSIPIQYYWVGAEWYGMFIIFIPVYVFLFLPFRMIIGGQTHDFLRAVGTLHWGLMIAVFSLSHLAFLVVLPKAGNPVAGGPGLMLYLLILTEINDVAQYTAGKLLGRHRILPAVSPNKTWEGFAGGLVATVALALALAPWLTPFGANHALLAGAMIGIGGFVGDATISAVKRDLGIKDTGTMLPGHGGILDRVDSLTFTAPLFFHFARYFYF